MTTTRAAAMSTHTHGTKAKAKTMSIPLSRIQTHAQQQHHQQQGAKIITLLLGMGAAITTSKVMNDTYKSKTTQCAASYNAQQLVKSGGDVVMLGPTQEKSTGIMFPHLCNGMQFVGCGVRIKYGFVKVYAVGTYMDPIAMSAIKSHGTSAIEHALLDPTYPRTIRIVMNRGLSIEKYTAAIVEALSPRMNGQELEKLDEFKALNPPVDLVEGAEMEMTIRGNVMLYKNSLGGVGQIESKVFCTALCDVYYGTDPVSPGHKEMVIKGVQNL
eukprot:CAMPEP_0204612958 /NCGR_PEP_ID=MMETSP0717-20131115/998_1 /ASSEMBLY_ACC=CAM_ASM_000666 /TAXON_ID=230516 /ORGANISM="Chaetoceros curvisetus" /LENGTH=270 /DNA_ID=CAMNT_0051625233 /DNA_START=135 /DNA_END=947 /DNA_ORIENTATION=-